MMGLAAVPFDRRVSGPVHAQVRLSSSLSPGASAAALALPSERHA